MKYKNNKYNNVKLKKKKKKFVGLSRLAPGMFIFFLSLKKISTSSLKVMQVCTAIDIYKTHAHNHVYT